MSRDIDAALERALLDELKKWTALIPVAPINPWFCDDETIDTNAPAGVPRNDTGE